MKELESSQVKDSGQQDANQQQREEGTDGLSHPMGKPMPRQEPQDGEQGVNGHHHHDTIRGRQQYRRYLGNNQRQRAPHIYVAPAAANDKVLVHGIERQESSAHAERPQEGHAVYPLVGDGDQDELMGHHGQAEHGGKGKEGREAEHLAENMRLPRLVVADFHKHGLGYLRHRARNKGAGHGVPLEGLGEVAHGLGGKQTAENNSQYVLGERIDDGGNQYLVAEGEHLADGLEVHPPGRPP